MGRNILKPEWHSIPLPNDNLTAYFSVVWPTNMPSTIGRQRAERLSEDYLASGLIWDGIGTPNGHV